MEIRWELWLARAMLCLFEMLLYVFVARFYLCVGVDRARIKWRCGKKKHRLLNTGRQPRWLVWLLYTDICSVHDQSRPLRLNMIMWIVALPYTASELLLGWLPPAAGMRVVLALCAVFFGICSFIAACVDHKRTFGSSLILYKRNGYSKAESSILDLGMLAISFAIARCYLYLHTV